jgi:glycosyltransferase involved in cell wall biosynthesis
MKILLLNKTDLSGGAAIACFRLLNALNHHGLDAKLLVQSKTSENSNIYSTTHSFLKQKLNFYWFAYERLIFSLYEKSKEVRFSFSIANTGEDIRNLEIVKKSDIIHLHWINQGYLSIDSIKKLLQLKKKIVWTLHDMWTFTGGCHYTGECFAYERECGKCPFLRKPNQNDLSHQLWHKKMRLFENAPITFVTCSNWLAESAKKSSILRNQTVKSIPNPIDTSLFSPLNKEIARQNYNIPTDKFIILFGSANILDKRKGIKYLIESLHRLKENNPKFADKIHLIMFGKSKQDISDQIPFPCSQIKFLTDTTKIAQLYSCADVFVLPSLEDNLPNTIMESLACGTPVVAFHSGGIPEMVDHLKNGYLADYKSAISLTSGLEWVINHPNKKELSLQARKKVMDNYTEQKIAEQYLKIYQ